VKPSGIWSAVQDTTETVQALKAHPAADLFPMMAEGDLAALAKDIAANGQHQPIVTFRDGPTWYVLDGRNRVAACAIAGVNPNTVEWHGEDPIAYVWGANVLRRQMDKSQIAMVGAKLATLKNGGDRGNQHTGGRLSAESLPDTDAASVAYAAQLTGVSVPSINRAKAVQRLGEESLIKAVEQGKVTVNAAERVARLPKEEQRAAVAAGPKAVQAAAQKVTAPKVGIVRKPRADALENILSTTEATHETWALFLDQGLEATWPGARHEDKAKLIVQMNEVRRVASKLIKALEVWT